MINEIGAIGAVKCAQLEENGSSSSWSMLFCGTLIALVVQISADSILGYRLNRFGSPKLVVEHEVVSIDVFGIDFDLGEFFGQFYQICRAILVLPT